MQETMKYRQEIMAESVQVWHFNVHRDFIQRQFLSLCERELVIFLYSKGALRRRALESRIMALRKVAKFWKAQSEMDCTPHKRNGEFCSNL